MVVRGQARTSAQTVQPTGRRGTQPQRHPTAHPAGTAHGHGLPVVEANRVTVEAIIDPWEAGESVEDIAYAYDMTPEQVDELCQAVVRLAS